MQHFMYRKIAKSLNDNQVKYTVIIIASVLALLLLMFIFKDRPSDDKSGKSRWRVHAITAKQTTASPELELYGTIINPFTSRLKSTIETYVKDVNIREGEYVAKDDILVQLDKDEIALEVEQKEAIVNEINAKLELEKEKYDFDKKSLEAEKKQVELTEDNLERQQELRKKRLNAQLTLDQAAIELQKIKINYYNKKLDVDSYPHRIAEIEAKLKQANADFKRAKLDLDRTAIKAPFDGYISRLYVSPGTRIQSNETILEIFNQDTIEIKIQVPQSTMAQIRNSINSADDIYAKTTIFNKTYELKFRSLTANQDVTSGGTDAFFVFKDPESTKDIRTIGKTVTVTLTLPETNNVFIIPTLSLHHNDRIYLIEDDKLKGVSVDVKGAIKSGSLEFLIIASDKIKDSDKILASVLPAAIDGLDVEIIEK